ncbi:hypothetical protein HPP92_022577 [Vanilla planifolia]|uniref:Structure-specific endonuclease subunit SLX1 homolog n=1 Tax=Vanilla planifolia TaxID=51239 RepID=A0A835PXM8_VANPL|nr:hypothetical protein HPP92_022577 [Vanilla planifolia]
MAMCIYGFSSNVAALQFEWAWQHPTESLAVRKAAATFKSLSGVANKIKLAYTMLTLPSWENLNLTVNFFSTKYTIHAAGCPRLPAQMRVNICTLDELPCYAEGQGATCKKGHIEEEDDGEELITGFIEVATDHFGQPLQAKETMEELCYFTHSPDRNIASASSTPSSCNEDGGMGKLRPVSSTAELIDLCTPLSCILRTKTKRALFDSEIIDLTDSPLSIQL